MGELFISGLFQAIISAIASGAALLIISRSLDKNNEDTKKAYTAEKELLDNRFNNMKENLNSMEDKFLLLATKHEELTEAFYQVKEKVVLLVQRQDEFKIRLFELIQAIEKKENKDPVHVYGTITKK